MNHSSIGYIIMGIANFHFFLAQEDMIAVIGVADVELQEEHSIHHAGHLYPLQRMPSSMKIAEDDVRYYVLLQTTARRFGLVANHLSFVDLQHSILFSALPMCMRVPNGCVSHVAFHDDGLLCASSAEALYAISENIT